jgi:disulfide bond formation protein DsbB
LCLIERIPYLLIIIIVILSFLLKKYEKLYLFLLSLIFISATLISLYHIGIEQGFIEESLVCELNSKTINLTTQDILSELKEKTISCKEVNFRIMGLSLATINTIISFVLSIIMGKLFFNYGKNK